PVHFSSTDPQAALPSNTPLTQGSGQFSATLRTAGTQSITVADVGTPSLTASQAGIAVHNAPASVLVVQSFPLAVTAGIAAPVAVLARDPFGNLDAGFAGVVHLTSSDPQAALEADAALSGGTRSFSAELRTAGGQSITAT